MPNDVPPLKVDDHDLSLWKLLEAVKSAWHFLVGGALVGLAGALGFVLLMPSQYEGTAVIQPATIGSVSTTGVSMKGAEVESVSQTLEHLKMPMFYTDDVLKACDVLLIENPRQALAAAVKSSMIKGNSLIRISYRANSHAIAKSCVGAVAAQLATTQAVLAEPIIKTLEEQRKLTKQQLDDAELFQRQIEKSAMAMSPSDAKFSQAMLMLNAALSKREEIFKLSKLYADQSVALAAPLTQSAKLFEPIYAPDNAVFPQKAMVASVGGLGGLVLGGLVFFLRRNYPRKARN